MKIALIIVSCYLLGSIPFGYIVGKLFKKVDIRELGSGNIGATNVFRILGPSLASLVLIGDIGKGIFSIYLVQYFNIDNLLIFTIAGLAVICGHDWSLFLGFKGGKGIATTFGVVFALNPIPRCNSFSNNVGANPLWLPFPLWLHIVRAGPGACPYGILPDALGRIFHRFKSFCTFHKYLGYITTRGTIPKFLISNF